MARHSHWAQIKLKKGALDKKRGKIFTKHAHLIEVAARTAGGDPAMNASLRLTIENARGDNMPRENIDRAIKKGTGEVKGAKEFQEIMYEGYGPGGIAFIIETLTDNKNRTSQIVRNTLQKYGGTLGAVGSTSFLFENKGEIMVGFQKNKEEDELAVIDAGADDIEEINDGLLIYTAPQKLHEVRKNLMEKGFQLRSAKLTLVPKNMILISDSETAKKILKLMEVLEEEEDISNVASNFDIEEKLLNESTNMY